MIWAVVDAKIELLVADWPTMNKDTHFGVLPTTASGTLLELEESTVIEQCLSKNFNLLGSNA
ncbi:hypothetical protein BG005_004203 [Podila minutissima]|nr:hypothetical protein BG005_004203 [Podila minutissima]